MSRNDWGQAKEVTKRKTVLEIARLILRRRKVTVPRFLDEVKDDEERGKKANFSIRRSKRAPCGKSETIAADETAQIASKRRHRRNWGGKETRFQEGFERPAPRKKRIKPCDNKKGRERRSRRKRGGGQGEGGG